MDPMGYIWLLYNNSIFQNYYVYCFFSYMIYHMLRHSPFDQAAAAWCRGTSSVRSCCGLAFCSVLHVARCWKHGSHQGKRKGKHVEKLKKCGEHTRKKSKVEIMLTTVIVMFPPKLQVRLSDWWLSHTFQTLVVAVPEDHHFKCCCNRQGWIEKSDT
jgi:hypothetical protein